MKWFVVLLFILLVGTLALADIGPSPSFSITISNADSHPDYAFYYVGNIWSDKLCPIAPDTSIYKLNTHLQVFAVPLDDPSLNSLSEDECISEADFDEVTQNAIISEVYSLPSGSNFYDVSLNTTTKNLTLELQENISDVPPALDIFIPILILIVAIVVVAFILKRKGKKK